jgi:hypothetical protein
MQHKLVVHATCNLVGICVSCNSHYYEKCTQLINPFQVCNWMVDDQLSTIHILFKICLKMSYKKIWKIVVGWKHITRGPIGAVLHVSKVYTFKMCCIVFGLYILIFKKLCSLILFEEINKFKTLNSNNNGYIYGMCSIIKPIFSFKLH